MYLNPTCVFLLFGVCCCVPSMSVPSVPVVWFPPSLSGGSRLEEPEHFSQLEEAARTVAKATSNMAAVASRHSTDTDDDVLRKEMVSLLEPITLSGQHVLLAAQKLSIQPNLTAHKEELITAAQAVFLGVVKDVKGEPMDDRL
ncbi:uncharacterized protein [Syngnathus scovelli]|uniref:uncharacterized protein n=1 Tax=Syngnathus scovelli TaxID=161590 RepID=UPI0035CCA41B